MQVFNRHDDEVELNFYSKDLLTNKRNLTLLSLQDVVDSARNLRDRMQRGEWDEEFKLGPDNTVNTYNEDSVVIFSNRLSVDVDKALFLRLLEEYVEMSENGESGMVTVYSNREVVKEIIS